MDVVGGSPSRTPSLNAYVYCESNPLRYTDPSGLWAGIAWVAAETSADALTFGADAAAAHEAFGARKWKQFAEKSAWAVVDLGFALTAGIPNPRSAIKAWRVSDEVASSLRGPSGFRGKLARMTGKLPAHAQAHHVFPQKFRPYFEKVGLKIDDPKYGSWWETRAQEAASASYNRKWEAFIRDNPAETVELDRVLSEGRKMAEDYGLTIYF